jgi:hypothetical protein
MSEPPATPSYGELAALVVAQAGVIESLRVEVGELRIEVAALRRQVGRDSSNSSQPPSADDPAATAKAKAGKRSGDQPAAGQASKRGQGGQKGHRGTGLQRVAVPDQTRTLEPPACAGCGGDLAGASGRIASSVQVFDLPTFCLLVTEYLMMRRTCRCGHVTTADLPAGVRGGPTRYGPNVTAAATLLASVDVIGIERAADLMSALLGVTVSTGFVSSCLVRLDTALTAAEFEEALKDALRAADVVGTDETPAPPTDQATAAEGCHNPHVYTVRTMGAYTRVSDGPSRDLVWYGAAGDRTKASISGFGILDTYRGVLVRDDYGGYLGYDGDLAGVQQCLAHALRYLDDVYAIDPASQGWARQVAGAGPRGRPRSLVAAPAASPVRRRPRRWMRRPVPDQHQRCCRPTSGWRPTSNRVDRPGPAADRPPSGRSRVPAATAGPTLPSPSGLSI